MNNSFYLVRVCPRACVYPRKKLQQLLTGNSITQWTSLSRIQLALDRTPREDATSANRCP